MASPTQTTAIEQEQELGDRSSNHPDERGSNDESASEGEETLPEGTTYSIYLKRLRTRYLQRIAGALGLAEDVSAIQTRKLLEEKLREMEREPCNVQVIVQGTNDDGNIFLVDETGIIKSVKGAVMHVSEHAQSDTGVRPESKDIRQLRSRIETLTAELQSVQQRLEEERVSGGEKDTEIATLQNLVAKEKQRVKRH